MKLKSKKIVSFSEHFLNLQTLLQLNSVKFAILTVPMPRLISQAIPNGAEPIPIGTSFEKEPFPISISSAKEFMPNGISSNKTDNTGTHVTLGLVMRP